MRTGGVICLAASLLLVGCGRDPEAAYLSDVREAVPAFVSSEDEALISAGRDVCMALGSGESIRDIRDTTAAAGLDVDAGLVIAESAVTHLCPDEDSGDVREMIDRLRS